MGQRELAPLPERREYREAIEKRLIALLRREIYEPVVRELQAVRQVKLTNATSDDDARDLIRAIAAGKIQYVDGRFEGQFSASTSKALRDAGAVWDRRTSTWQLSAARLTPDMSTAIGASYSRFKKLADRISAKLEAVSPQLLGEQVKLEGVFNSQIYRVNRDFEAQIKGITVAPQLTDADRARIASQYNNNMRLYIQTFAEKEIKKLRDEVGMHAAAGARYESMFSMIRSSYDVSVNKAKFLARQETNLLMSNFQETRYRSAGMDQYKWECVAGTGAHPVRPDHKLLDGTIQSWSNPPITNRSTGARNHPGRDFGCRCRSRPIIRF